MIWIWRVGVNGKIWVYLVIWVVWYALLSQCVVCPSFGLAYLDRVSSAEGNRKGREERGRLLVAPARRSFDCCWWNKIRRRQAWDLSNKMRRWPDFLTKSSWVLCPVNAVCNLFSITAQNLLLLMNELMNSLTFGRPIVHLFSPLPRT